MLCHKNVCCILSAAHISYTQRMTARDAVAYRMHVAAAWPTETGMAPCLA